MIKHSKHNCWIFDIDGVLTHPQEKKVVNESLWNQFIIWLQDNNPIALNTGRSIEWVEEKILIPLKQHLEQQKLSMSLLHNLIIVGEKGADWLTFDAQGQEIQNIDKKISIPQKLISQVKKLTNEKFSDSMFFDDTKKTMISIEMKKNKDLNDFYNSQQQLIIELKKIINDKTLTIDATVIATDIQHKNTGKALGIERIIDWINKRNLDIDHFYTFGDSKSDIDMAYKLQDIYKGKKKVIFIYVGSQIHWKDQELKFSIYHYPGFNEGTAQFLATMK